MADIVLLGVHSVHTLAIVTAGMYVWTNGNPREGLILAAAGLIIGAIATTTIFTNTVARVLLLVMACGLAIAEPWYLDDWRGTAWSMAIAGAAVLFASSRDIYGCAVKLDAVYALVLSATMSSAVIDTSLRHMSP
jgi:hypothetical protein